MPATLIDIALACPGPTDCVWYEPARAWKCFFGSDPHSGWLVYLPSSAPPAEVLPRAQRLAARDSLELPDLPLSRARYESECLRVGLAPAPEEAFQGEESPFDEGPETAEFFGNRPEFIERIAQSLGYLRRRDVLNSR